MSRLRVWLRCLVERLLSRFYEGPEPPPRLRQAARSFAVVHAGASVGDWLAFSVRLAEEAYRSGYVRGLEHERRDRPRAQTREEHARLTDDRHGWSWVDLGPSDEELARLVEQNRDVLDRMQPEQRALVLDSIGRSMGTHRVVVVPNSDTKAR